MVRKAYRFRLDPSSRQREALERFAGARRFVWNWSLATWKAYYADHGKRIPAKELSARLTALKSQPATAWLRDIDAQVLQQALSDLHRAFGGFFAHRARYPRLKSKKRDRARFRIPQTVTLARDRLRIPKIGLVPLRLSRSIPGETKSATFSRDACGHWFVSIVAEVGLPCVSVAIPARDATVGLDRGLKDAVVLSTGERVAAPRFFRKSERRLARVQRSLSRKKNGSKNREKARVKVARIHQKVADQRRDFTHKLTTHIIRSSRAVCVETLGISAMARTKLSKSVMDVAMAEIRRQLEYKGEWCNVPVIAVAWNYPSSKTCHACGNPNPDLTLSDRIWICPMCGSVLDRDFNAAQNIRDEGYRLMVGKAAQ